MSTQADQSVVTSRKPRRGTLRSAVFSGAVMLLGMSLAAAQGFEGGGYSGEGGYRPPNVEGGAGGGFGGQYPPQLRPPNVVFDPIESEMGVDPASVDRPVALSHSFVVGEAGTVNLSGGGMPQTGSSNFGVGFNARPDTFFRQASVNFNANENQFVANGGFTANLFEAEGLALGTRLLFGTVVTDNIDNKFHFTNDLYYGQQIPSILGENWYKVGFFIDQQEDLGKLGPSFGLLMNADSRFPITVDAALGFGIGGTQSDIFERTTTFTRVADYDAQLRIGTFLTSNCQVGFSTDYAQWDSPLFDDDDVGYGAFANLTYGTFTWQFDITTTGEEVRGYANLVMGLDGFVFRRGDQPQGSPGSGYGVDGIAWATRPVLRDTTLRIQQFSVTAPLPQAPAPPPVQVGNISPINAVAVFPIRTPGDPTGDANGNGVIDAGESFELDFGFRNNTAQTAQNVSFGLSTATVIGPATQVGLVGDVIGNVAPGQTIVTDDLSDADILVNATAQPGDQIFFQYEVTADGQTQVFQAGPFIVGQIRNGVPVGVGFAGGPPPPPIQLDSPQLSSGSDP
ncbi:hypothetical protein [Stratiformator vulcanicus]|uniref:Inverse autotransporter beta-domain domain-containing protein n=1 Tax=Stratiformator vulcanicus TaxID=2527980 RepID=A0A517QYP8_9PLAN|nr:hypothetical protein [Stratiformator vulcanicus]QDT36713.1 hypothetical protein Pan189_10760 [Stratiformator vulcanicus]